MKTRFELYVNFDSKTIGYREAHKKFLHKVGDTLLLNSKEFIVYANFDLDEKEFEVFKVSFKVLFAEYKNRSFCDLLNKMVEGLILGTSEKYVSAYFVKKEEIRRKNEELSYKAFEAFEKILGINA